MADAPVNTPPPPASPLGVDPKDNTPSPSNAPPKDTAPVVPKGKTLTDAEYTELLENSNNYKAIASEPQLVSHIRDHFRGKLGQGNPGQPNPNPGNSQPNDDLRRDIDSLKRDNKMLRDHLAHKELASFYEKHPDMVDHKDQ